MKKIWNFIAVFVLTLLFGMFLTNITDYFEAHADISEWIISIAVSAYVAILWIVENRKKN
ncbi:gp021 (endogenous virus) [Lactococcus phage KSY1]|uniref:Gp021 n=1 Tax=Lactococcus phage KSY1 TaxID=2913972 RepID=A6MA85_9CAUD|nr:gp021 [Lactococcus phage KSY1]ABG21563.1 gp021 [Lactococcus phage KSY1]